MEFYKYQGTGNDFVMIDDRAKKFAIKDTDLVAKICHRKFGIGADGVILIAASKKADFEMKYFNADGALGSMCGNGGRCAVAFAKKLGIIENETKFLAYDGMHNAAIEEDGIVSLKMNDVDNVIINENQIFLDTGSPHHIEMVDSLKEFDVEGMGRKIRHSVLYGPEGSNINFVIQTAPNAFEMRTYERGVEAETLSCGTGATAVAIAMQALEKTRGAKISIETLGGKLEVSYNVENGKYTEVFLRGDATFVFKGDFEC